MTADTVIAPTRLAPTRAGHVAEVLRSEFCKLRSVPSTFWTLSAAVASNVMIAALAAIFIPSHLSAQDTASTDGVRLSLAGVHLSQVAFGVLGALVITSEYGTGWTVPALVDTRVNCPMCRENKKWVRRAGLSLLSIRSRP